MSFFRTSAGVAFLVIGLLQLVWCLVEACGAIASQAWPVVVGEITSSTVIIAHGRGVGHIPTVDYAYRIAGTSFHGARIHYGDAGVSLPEGEASALVARYPVGMSVLVHYDPSVPSEAVLVPGLWSYSYGWFALSVIAVAVGGTMVVANIRKGRTRAA
jgi:hypothetical protein